MLNIPKMKVGLVAVSRDCFPESLSVNRRKALVEAYEKKFGKDDIYECPVCIVESEIQMQEALAECAAECGAETKCLEELNENGYPAMKRLEDFRPDCILMTDPAFSGVWEYMLEHSLKCPEDLFLIRYGREKNDHTLPGRAAIEVGGDSVRHGAAALQMLLKDSKDTIKLDLEMKCMFKE